MLPDHSGPVPSPVARSRPRAQPGRQSPLSLRYARTGRTPLRSAADARARSPAPNPADLRHSSHAVADVVSSASPPSLNSQCLSPCPLWLSLELEGTLRDAAEPSGVSEERVTGA